MTSLTNRQRISKTQTIIILDEDLKSSDPTETIPSEFDLPINEATLNSNPDYSPSLPLNLSKFSLALSATSEYCRIVWDLFYGQNGADISFAVATSNRRKFKLLPDYEGYLDSNNLQNKLSFFTRYSKRTKDIKEIESKMLIQKILERIIHTNVKKVQENDLSFFKAPIRVILVTSTTGHNLKAFQHVITSSITQMKQQLSGQHSNNLSIETLPEILISIVNLNENVNDRLGNTVELISVPNPDFSNVDQSSLDYKTKCKISNEYASQLTSTLINLAKSHYNLVVTTVSEIPMKEAEAQTDSKNYEVGLLHEKPKYWKNLSPDESELKLKWFNPKLDNLELYSSMDAIKICPREVNSRHSICLTNFILRNNRSVLLASCSKSDGKPTNNTPTHILTTHGGDIYLHALISGGKKLGKNEDNPLINKVESPLSNTGKINGNLLDVINIPDITSPASAGSSVKTYRTDDFKNLTKELELLPTKQTLNQNEAKKIASKLTTIFPYTHSGMIKLTNKMVQSKELNDTPFNLPLLFGMNKEHGKKGFSPLVNIPTHYIIQPDEVQQVYRVFKMIIESSEEGLPKIFNKKKNKDVAISKKHLIAEMYIYINKLQAVQDPNLLPNNSNNNKSCPHDELQQLVDEELKKHDMANENLLIAKNTITTLFEKFIDSKTSFKMDNKDDHSSLKSKSKSRIESFQKDDLNQAKGIKDSDDAVVVFESPASPSKDSEKDQYQETGLFSKGDCQHKVQPTTEEAEVDPFLEIVKNFKKGKIKFSKKPVPMNQTLAELYEMTSKSDKEKNINRTFFARMDQSTGKPIPDNLLHNHKFKLYAYMDLENSKNSNKNEKDSDKQKDEFYRQLKNSENQASKRNKSIEEGQIDEDTNSNIRGKSVDKYKIRYDKNSKNSGGQGVSGVNLGLSNLKNRSDKNRKRGSPSSGMFGSNYSKKPKR